MRPRTHAHAFSVHARECADPSRDKRAILCRFPNVYARARPRLNDSSRSTRAYDVPRACLRDSVRSQNSSYLPATYQLPLPPTAMNALALRRPNVDVVAAGSQSRSMWSRTWRTSAKRRSAQNASARPPTEGACELPLQSPLVLCWARKGLACVVWDT
eukprot:6188953-Pleurochrysis_carterae.AAC.3